jgi:hypothetical protein
MPQEYKSFSVYVRFLSICDTNLHLSHCPASWMRPQPLQICPRLMTAYSNRVKTSKANTVYVYARKKAFYTLMFIIEIGAPPFK